MLTCRFFVGRGQPLSAGLHVHDEPGHVVDALRCKDNGWTVWVDGECHVDGPASKGDSKASFNTIIDYVGRPTLQAPVERALYYAGRP